MTIKRMRLAVAVIAVVAALAACGGSDEPKAGADASSIRIAGFLFKPEKLSVAAGTAVTWTNTDDIEHTITAGVPGSPSGAFDSGDRSKGETFTHTFTGAGTFTYFCNNHKSMRGEVDVT